MFVGVLLFVQVLYTPNSLANRKVGNISGVMKMLLW